MNFKSFPSTRYQGSKRKLLEYLHEIFSSQVFSTALDVYSGTGSVSLLLRQMAKTVQANDILLFNNVCSSLLLKTNNQFLLQEQHTENLNYLLLKADISERRVSDQYDGIFFLQEENQQIDRFCQHVNEFPEEHRCLYRYCIGQALMMKRPYNLFHRANLSMRTRQVKRNFGNAKTWETPIFEHASRILNELRRFPFAVDTFNAVSRIDAGDVCQFSKDYDLIYLDPPYNNALGNCIDYGDFYHFLEGIVDYDLFHDADLQYAHRPIIKGKSSWATPTGGANQLRSIVEHFPDSTIVLSYRSDGSPTIEQLEAIFRDAGRDCEAVTSEKPYKYVLSKLPTKEIIIVSKPNRLDRIEPED